MCCCSSVTLAPMIQTDGTRIKKQYEHRHFGFHTLHIQHSADDSNLLTHYCSPFGRFQTIRIRRIRPVRLTVWVYEVETQLTDGMDTPRDVWEQNISNNTFYALKITHVIAYQTEARTKHKVQQQRQQQWGRHPLILTLTRYIRTLQL